MWIKIGHVFLSILCERHVETPLETMIDLHCSSKQLKPIASTIRGISSTLASLAASSCH